MTKHCSKCNRWLDESNFHKNKSTIDGLHSWCKDCHKEYYTKNIERLRKKYSDYYKKIKDTDHYKNHRKKYEKKFNATVERKNYMKKHYHEKRREYYKQRYIKNKENILKINKKWKKSENGRNAIKKYKSKRYRNFNYIKLWNNPFPDDIEVEDHHYDNWFVIPMPKTTHRYNLGDDHREYNADWIEKLYSINTDDILGGKL